MKTALMLGTAGVFLSLGLQNPAFALCGDDRQVCDRMPSPEVKPPNTPRDLMRRPAPASPRVEEVNSDDPLSLDNLPATPPPRNPEAAYILE